MEELAREVKEWWELCTQYNITVSEYKWIPREENGQADRASKYVAQNRELQGWAGEWIERWMVTAGLPRYGWSATRLYVSGLDNVRLRLEAIERTGEVACVVVPHWPGQVWWPLLLRQLTRWEELGAAGTALCDTEQRSAGRGETLLLCLVRGRAGRDGTAAAAAAHLHDTDTTDHATWKET